MNWLSETIEHKKCYISRFNYSIYMLFKSICSKVTRVSFNLKKSNKVDFSRNLCFGPYV